MFSSYFSDLSKLTEQGINVLSIFSYETHKKMN